MGVPLSVGVGVGRADHRIRRRVRRRWRWQHHGVRIRHREEPVALPARVLDAGHRRDDLYARRPSVFAGAGREHADGVCAAAAALRLTMKLYGALALLLLGAPVANAAPTFHADVE